MDFAPAQALSPAAMKRALTTLCVATASAATLMLAGCGGEQQEAGGNTAENTASPAAPGSPAPAPVPAPSPAGATAWQLQASDAGTTLALVAAGGAPTIRIVCPARQETLVVSVPGFRAIGSEERMSFGSGGDVVALVADVRGDKERGGVTASGAVKEKLSALLGGAVSASYGAQTSGPHPAPPAAVAGAFVAACRPSAQSAAQSSPPSAPPSAGAASPCLMQDGARLDVTPRRAIGTEPFWNARIEGRCVTYSHPEDQAGTRVWTRYAKNGEGETWTGALGGRRLALRIRPAPGCSDGMSDRRYKFAAELDVAGEKRTGCAEAGAH
jgi:uncharacterized membrane protein